MILNHLHWSVRALLIAAVILPMAIINAICWLKPCEWSYPYGAADWKDY